jgi:hypothetical protein
MTAAGNTLLTLLIFWGLPLYLIDRRARHNDRPGWMRFTIAFFMLFYFLIVPVFVALNLAGPKRPRGPGPRPGPDPRPDLGEIPLHDPRSFQQGLEKQRARARQRHKEAQARQQSQRLEALSSQRPQLGPSRQTQTHPYLTPQQKHEQHELAQHYRRREREQQRAEQQREAEQRAAQLEAQALDARRQRQDRADRERQAQNDLFMTWDERGEEELLE